LYGRVQIVTYKITFCPTSVSWWECTCRPVLVSRP